MSQSPTPATHIIVKGAREHNLKNIAIDIPKNKLVVMTGLSGSGKSSLAFDTIYAEGQRKYVESLSSYARQFLGVMHKPDVDSIEGLSPAISIDQKTTSHNPRSTVGTITEIYDYLRLLFARIGHPHCPNCGKDIAPQTIDQIHAQLLDAITLKAKSNPVTRWLIVSPIVRDKKGEFSGLLTNLKQKGFLRVRIDGHVKRLDEDITLIKTNKHSIDVVVDRVSLAKSNLKQDEFVQSLRTRLHQSLQSALDLSNGLVVAVEVLDPGEDFPEAPKQMHETLYSQELACADCRISFGEVEPRLFSFNTPHGACPTCTGLGTLLKFDPSKYLAPALSVPEGAIIPLANAFSHETWLAKKVRALFMHYGVDYKTPFGKLDESFKKLLLDGDSSVIRVSGTNVHGYMTSFKTTFDGFSELLKQRHRETTSDYVRGQLEAYMTKEVCPTCLGSRLKKEALSVTVTDKNIHDVVSTQIEKTHAWVQLLQQSIEDANSHLLTPSEKTIAKMVVKEIAARLNFLQSVGLGYLTLDREAATLAGGEAQRIRLASQIGTGLTGVLYVLDEPSIGLHPRDNTRLITTLKNLRDLGNSVLVVEHDKEIMLEADHLIDIGPLAGEHGGEVIFEGTLESAPKNAKSLTLDYVRGQKQVDLRYYQPDKVAKALAISLQANKKILNQKLRLKGAREHNLKNISVDFPLGKLVVVTGVSGSGKSTLIHDTLYPSLKLALGLRVDRVAECDALEGSELVDRVIMIDQSPIGRTPRSNPATYTKTFDYIREIFATTKDAKERGFKPGHFSFNVPGGRCEACKGDGQVRISMQFLPDVFVTCDVCKGKRYNSETLTIQFKGKSIADVLDTPVSQAIPLFGAHRNVLRKLKTLEHVGLGYIRLGQSAPTLSGGEAQRIKLSRELSTLSAGHNLYLLDEPTTGLHFEDVKKLLMVLKTLTAQNNTVIVIEHNLDVIKNADYLIDLGPEGGDGGGSVVGVGTPQELAANKKSYTGQYLAHELLQTPTD
jgi:excinuclease ABC subunit A